MGLKYIYVAGPYSFGDVTANVRKAVDAATKLLDFGFAPYLPHLTHYWDMMHPRSYLDWCQFDLVWLEKCDAVLRLPGESGGADREVEYARAHDIPVYETIADLIQAAKARVYEVCE